MGRANAGRFGWLPRLPGLSLAGMRTETVSWGESLGDDSHSNPGKRGSHPNPGQGGTHAKHGSPHAASAGRYNPVVQDTAIRLG